MKKQILVVVDFQNDFVDGSLGFSGAERLDDRIAEKIQACRREGGEVLFTFDTHAENYLHTQEGQKLPVLHCVKGTPGWELYGRTGGLKRPEDRSFEKGTFGSWELGEYLREGGYDRVELVGLVSNICVLTNAVIAKTALPEALVVVDASCTASFDDKIHEETLNVLEGLQVEVINRGRGD